MIPAIVKSVQAGEDYCNCTVETEAPMRPYTTPYTITLNTGQVELRDPPDEEVK